jgi:ABC-type ATPase with predicted acetyltransferase domain
MDKGDILYCIKEVGHILHLNYIGNTRVEPGYDEYEVDFEVGKSYVISIDWGYCVTIWKPIKDSVKLGLSPNAKADNIPFYYKDVDIYKSYNPKRMSLWDYFVTEEEYKNIKRTEIIDRMLNDTK